MRIAYLNPWENAAENQAYASLAQAAEKLGHELIDCRVPENVEHAVPDFVISVASSIPKIADFPSYLTVHEPKRRFLESAFYFSNLLTYDGYLTISDTLETFVRDLCFGVGRSQEVGFYFNTPQVTDIAADLQRTAEERDMRVVYLGTNWDRRLPDLFRELDGSAILRIHGPNASWKNERYVSYAGPLPFDGIAPQKAYARAGIGLVLLSADHLKEDVISNRIFEIVSVGAMAICPDIPWIRKWFGESVLYFSSDATARAIAGQIRMHYDYCVNNPTEAQSKADAARAIFERMFAAERMIANAVRYHEKMQSKGPDPALQRISEPHISVIVRCGGRSATMVRQAVDSIRRQTFGRFTVVFSKYADIDVSEIVTDRSGAIVAFTEVLTPAGNRAATLTAGLKAISTEYFAVLDDDDFWLRDHVETLFTATTLVDPEFDLAYSGTVELSSTWTQIEKSLKWNRNVYTFGLDKSVSAPFQVGGKFASNCFVARSTLISPPFDDLGDLSTAEDSLLISILVRRKPPVFSYKATAFFRRGFEGESGFHGHRERADDELTWALRGTLLFAPRWMPTSSLEWPMERWPRILEARSTQHDFDRLARLPARRSKTAEGWELISILSLGTGERGKSDCITGCQGRSGHLCYGPYLRLPAGEYRVDFHIVVSRWLSWFSRLRTLQPIGQADVVCVDPEWTGGYKDFFASGKTSISFSIPSSLVGRIELRLFSHGHVHLRLTSVVLWRY